MYISVLIGFGPACGQRWARDCYERRKLEKCREIENEPGRQTPSPFPENSFFDPQKLKSKIRQ